MATTGRLRNPTADKTEGTVNMSRRWFIAALTSIGIPLPIPAASPLASTPTVLPDDRTVMLAVSILQPVDRYSVQRFLMNILPEFHLSEAPGFIEAALERGLDASRLLIVKGLPEPLFSLTLDGQNSLARPAQLLRDRARLFLLRGKNRSMVIQPRRGDNELPAGVPPSENIRPRIENFFATRAAPGSADVKSGFRSHLRGTILPLISFHDRSQVNLALTGKPREAPFTLQDLSVCLGLSVTLLTWFIDNPGRNYREFEIQKRGGGKRKIESPRIFLKVTHRLLLQSFLKDLKVHECVFSFRKLRPAILNATFHQGRKYIGRIDIKNFFESITVEMVNVCFIDHGWEKKFARSLASICTKDKHLPQGAPTSPIISNAILFKFDDYMYNVSKDRGFRYSRYADDIIVSGDNKPGINQLLLEATSFLKERYGLVVNPSKTRFMPYWRRQRVTGFVVNQAARPPREFRRRIRAIFHEASKDPERFRGQVGRLSGYISYLESIPELRGSKELTKYHAVLESVRRN